MYSRWGDVVLTVMDWSHSQCDDWESQSDLVHLQCERPARVPGVLGGSRGVAGWGRTVARGREAGGEWLDSCVEERCALGFTGVDLARVDAGPVMIYAVNAAGDLFAKSVVPKNDTLDDTELEHELVEIRENSWLADWGDSVVSCSLLPEISLRCKQRPVKEKLNKNGVVCTREWSMPVTVKTKEWRRRFGYRRKKLYKKQNDDESASQGEVGEKIAISRAGLPRLSSSTWPPELYEVVTGDNKKKSKRLKVEKMREMLNKMNMRPNYKSSLYLAPSSSESHNYNHPTPSVARKFAPILDLRESEDSKTLYNHLVPHLEKLDLTNYAPGTSYKYSNRHSESILKIMMGKGETGKVAERRDSSQPASGQPSPAPPKEEDSMMEAFWADLGVEAPPPPDRRGSQARSFASSDQEEGWDV